MGARDVEECVVYVVEVCRSNVEGWYQVEGKAFNIVPVDDCGRVGEFGYDGFE